MSPRSKLFLSFGFILLAGACQTQQQTLDQGLPRAMETALSRGRFDLGCPNATGVLLSDDFIQPALQGPWVGGIERMEYTIGVEGCGQKTTIIAICQQGTGTCFAANPDHGWRQGGQP